MLVAIVVKVVAMFIILPHYVDPPYPKGHPQGTFIDIGPTAHEVRITTNPTRI